MSANKKLKVNCYCYLKPFKYLEKMGSGSFKNVIPKMCSQIIYI